MINTNSLHQLRVNSLNCKNVKTNVEDVRRLCEPSDICILQETWLREDELEFLKSIHKDFSARGTSAMDTGADILSGRPYGGVGILWRSNLNLKVRIKSMGDPRFIRIELEHAQGVIVHLVCVYMPYECDENEPDYAFYLGLLKDFIDSCETNRFALIGDWNARPNSKFGELLFEFVHSNGLIASDFSLLPQNSFTFISEAHSTTSWLDHCISSPLFHNMINSCNI